MVVVDPVQVGNIELVEKGLFALSLSKSEMKNKSRRYKK